MNVNASIKKLLKALEVRGTPYYINQEQFYFERVDKVCTKYIVFHDNPRNDGVAFYSKVKLLQYLADIYKKVGEHDG